RGVQHASLRSLRHPVVSVSHAPPGGAARERGVHHGQPGPRARPGTSLSGVAVIMGRFLPPNPDAGDERTVGGYAAVHSRPPALEGPDGYAYSVEPSADRSGDPEHPWGGFLLFLRWRRIGAQGVEGHLETGFLALANSHSAALEAVRSLSLES